MAAVPDVPGIRVVRLLARDAHLESVLVHLELEQGRGAPAVLERALDETGARRRRGELAALERARGAGVARVLDAIDDALAPGLLLEYLPGRTLAELLRTRERWDAGEAVTVLLPIAVVIERIHAAGVAHGALSPARVVLSGEGTILADFTHAELFPAHAPEVVLDTVAAVARDREALREIAASVLGRVEGSRSGAAHELARRISGVAGHELCSLLRRGLEELAAAVPVREADPGEQRLAGAAGEAAPAGAIAADEVATSGPGTATTELRGRLSGVRDRVAPLVRAARERIARYRALLDRLPTARRRLLVAGAAAVLTAAALLAVMPDGGAEHAAERDTPSSAASGSPDAPGAAHARAAAITGDDPAAALPALLELREECIRQLSLLCLEGVTQPGSAAAREDREVILALQAGDEARGRSVVATAPRVIERQGDSALVATGAETDPASLLLMRGEAGWRIRDWVAASGQMPSEPRKSPASRRDLTAVRKRAASAPSTMR